MLSARFTMSLVLLWFFLLSVDAWGPLLLPAWKRSSITSRIINATPTARRASSSSSSSAWTQIATIEGPFRPESFAEAGCWGKKPLLLKRSFADDDEDDDATRLLPSWNDICELAISPGGEGESITSRLITHKPGTLDTFKLHFGPFSESELSNFIETEEDEEDSILPDDDSDDDKDSDDDDYDYDNDSRSQVSTLVVNDVDRLIPSLSDWMDKQFGFLPRWRRDDAQVSLARIGGGIGPHVDNYDVFLIQVSGTRTWKVGLETLSVKDEFDNLVKASEVRVLDLEGQSLGEFVTMELGPGDCLYLPPRVVHWGSSTSDDCMTLSVGCRAPSAAELVQRVAVSIADSSSVVATARYTDFEDILSWTSDAKPGESQKGLSKKVKDKLKRLVLDLIEEQLENDAVWEKLVGEFVTEPKRPTTDYPIALSDMEEDWKADLGVWGNSETALEAVMNGNGVLRRAEGIAFAWSSSSLEDKDGQMGPILFAQGRSFPLNDNSNATSSLLLDIIANGLPLSQQRLEEQGIQLSKPMKSFLLDLLEEGLLYGDDDDDSHEDDENDSCCSCTINY